MLLAFAGDNIPCDAFFNEDGKPLTFADVCQQAKAQIDRMQAESKETRGYLRFLTITVSKWNALLTTWNIGLWSYVFSLPAGAFVLTSGAALVAFAYVDDHFSGKLRNAINKKIKQDIKQWPKEMVRSSSFRIKDSVHQDIRKVCSDGEDASIRDVRLYVMRRHPRMTARVLVHPDGRLLTESEICKAISLYA